MNGRIFRAPTTVVEPTAGSRAGHYCFSPGVYHLYLKNKTGGTIYFIFNQLVDVTTFQVGGLMKVFDYELTTLASVNLKIEDLGIGVLDSMSVYFTGGIGVDVTQCLFRGA